MNPISPQCADGDHAACSGYAWDDDVDELTGCRCQCHDREATRLHQLHELRMAALWAERYPVPARRRGTS